MGKIYFVRHGDAEHNVLCVPASNVNDIYGLTAAGRDEAVKCKEQLANIKFDQIFTSRLKRAAQTCGIIVGGDRIKDIQIDNRIIDRDWGVLTGKRYKPTQHGGVEFNVIKSMNYNLQKDFPNMESMDDLEKRMFDFIDDVKAKYPGRNVLVVTHNNCVSMVKVYLYGRPKSGSILEDPLYYVKNCEIVEIEN